MPQYKIFFARFPYKNAECPDSTDWFAMAVYKAKTDPRFSEVYSQPFDDTPITMTRNMAVKTAREAGCDLLCMLDSDMGPDSEPDSKPFWETTINFMLAHSGPCLVAAPYCGPPPHENMFVFQWAMYRNNEQSPHNAGLRLEQYTREEAQKMVGIGEVAALPTGLILIDMRAFKPLTPPYFYYEWADKEHSAKASTEDVTFTRDVSLSGTPVYCNWDAWAVHHKDSKVRKPRLWTMDAVREEFRVAVLSNRKNDDKMMNVAQTQIQRLSEPARLAQRGPVTFERGLNGLVEAQVSHESRSE